MFLPNKKVFAKKEIDEWAPQNEIPLQTSICACRSYISALKENSQAKEFLGAVEKYRMKHEYKGYTGLVGFSGFRDGSNRSGFSGLATGAWYDKDMFIKNK